MVEGGKGEMDRIYLNSSGPGNKWGPRAKRMFVPLAATQRAAQIMGGDGIHGIPYATQRESSFMQNAYGDAPELTTTYCLRIEESSCHNNTTLIRNSPLDPLRRQEEALRVMR